MVLRFQPGILKMGMAMIALSLAAQAANAHVSGGLLPNRNGNGNWVNGGWHSGSGHHEPLYPGYRAPEFLTDSVRMTVGRQFQGFTKLNVTQLMAIAVQGREILSLSVRMSAQGGRSQAILLENGRAVGQPVIVPAYAVDAEFYVERPNSRNLLELNLNGPIYLSEITATVRDFGRPGAPGGPVRPGRPGGGHYGPIELREFVGQAFYSGGEISLDQLMGLRNYTGKWVKQVVIRASSRRGRGTAELLINGFSQRFQVALGTSLSEYYLTLPSRSQLGYDIQSLDLAVQGNVFIESVTVELQ
jgi:hypothetical protein